jgi:predicted glycosyl hydrolase (DUF1957 family)
MSAILDRDKIDQVEKMSSYIKEKFGCKETKELWLAERVWESSMSRVLSESGIDYTVLDDFHFVATGMDTEKLDEYYTTEEDGYKMRYLIP